MAATRKPPSPEDFSELSTEELALAVARKIAEQLDETVIVTSAGGGQIRIAPPKRKLDS
jgi:hypothetical protein